MASHFSALELNACAYRPFMILMRPLPIPFLISALQSYSPITSSASDIFVVSKTQQKCCCIKVSASTIPSAWIVKQKQISINLCLSPSGLRSNANSCWPLSLTVLFYLQPVQLLPAPTLLIPLNSPCLFTFLCLINYPVSLFIIVGFCLFWSVSFWRI